MAYSFLVDTGAGSTGPTTGCTTAAVDTSGATLLVLVAHFFGSASLPTLSDSKSNTWLGLTRQGGNLASSCRIYYCLTPIVGSGHTFSASTVALNDVYVSITMAAFSEPTPAYDVENGTYVIGGNTSASSGAVTPSGANSLVIAGLTYAGSLPAVSGGSLAITETVAFVGGQTMGAALAYEIQTSATARTASWTWTTGSDAAVPIAVFSGTAGGGGATFNALLVSP